MFSLVEDLLGFLFSKLPTYQLVIITFLLQKLEMFSLLDDLSVLHHKDKVRIADCGKTMGDQERSSSFENLICSLLNQLLGLGINGGSGLIQNENSGVCARTALAKEISCFSPVESRSPPSPTSL